ncbi:MAG TPA: ISLre2 family transposase, partial [Lactobacillus sp.]|nr:ISLre2 family transposase [Lactobacillus sp.]
MSQLVLASEQSFRNHLCQLIGQALEEKDQVIMESSYRRQFYRIKDKRERTFLS